MILLTTTKALLLLDLVTGRYGTIHEGSGLYYGMVEYEDRYYVGARNLEDCYIDEEDDRHSLGEILVFDRQLIAVSKLPSPEFGLTDIHGMAIVGDELWVSNTGRDSIAIWSFSTGTWSEWFPRPSLGRGRDVQHLNTVTVCGQEVHLIAHNHGQSELLRIEPESRDILGIEGLGEHAHGVIYVEDDCYYSDSANGMVTKNSQHFLRVSGFPRSIAAVYGEMLVTVSQKMPRLSRNDSDSMIVRFERGGHITGGWRLPSAGMALDIMAVEGPAESCLTQKAELHVPSLEFNAAEEIQPGIRFGPAWQYPESTRWSAGREAELAIFCNPGEVCLTLALVNPGPDVLPVRLEVKGGDEWSGNLEGYGENIVALSRFNEGSGWVILRVSSAFLMSPSSRLGTTDERRLGVGIKDITV